jgi:hypothetical protein
MHGKYIMSKNSSDEELNDICIQTTVCTDGYVEVWHLSMFYTCLTECE